ncbi:MAG: cupredoxin domain-containing protein [Nanoarchaeota archaeon]
MKQLLMMMMLLFVLASCSQNKTPTSLDSYTSIDSAEDAPTTTTATSNTVQEMDGVQTVTLSWGKFNYNPETITVSVDKPVRIIADLTRLQGCFQSLVIPDLGIEHYFDEGSESLEFTPTKIGTYAFTCAMGMGKGTLVVE